MYNEPVSISRLMRPLNTPMPMNAAAHEPSASRSSDLGPLRAFEFMICVVTGHPPPMGSEAPGLPPDASGFAAAGRPALHQVLVHHHELTALDQGAADFLVRLRVDQEGVLAGVAENVGDIDHARGLLVLGDEGLPRPIDRVEARRIMMGDLGKGSITRIVLPDLVN